MAKTNISAKLKGNKAFEMDIDGHTLITDTSVLNGGNNFGPSPKALLLAGLIGCSGIDIMNITKQMEIKIEDLKVDIEADSRKEDPKIYTYIKIVYKFKGKDLSYEKLEEAVKLSMEKYCGVTAMLEKAVPISHEIQLEE